MKRTSFLVFLTMSINFYACEIQASTAVSPYADRVGIDLIDTFNIEPNLASHTTGREFNSEVHHSLN